MTPWLEIVLPVRNPGDKLLETAASLVAQTARGFGVVLSDNHSTSGSDLIEQARTSLEAADIPARVVRPPVELGRVEHWNWALGQAAADWLKPLFVGDLLAPEYAARLHDRMLARPAARFIRCELETRTPEGSSIAHAPTAATSLTPAEFLQLYPRHGNWIGGPVNAAFHRLAWQSAGGYMPQLPACADLQLAVTIALRHGLELIHEPLAIFQLHSQRFSHGIARRYVNGCFELWLILRQARNYCLNTDLPWPADDVRDGVLLQVRIDYLDPWKQRVKDRLGW